MRIFRAALAAFAMVAGLALGTVAQPLQVVVSSGTQTIHGSKTFADYLKATGVSSFGSAAQAMIDSSGNLSAASLTVSGGGVITSTTVAASTLSIGGGVSAAAGRKMVIDASDASGYGIIINHSGSGANGVYVNANGGGGALAFNAAGGDSQFQRTFVNGSLTASSSMTVTGNLGVGLTSSLSLEARGAEHRFENLGQHELEWGDGNVEYFEWLSGTGGGTILQNKSVPLTGGYITVPTGAKNQLGLLTGGGGQLYTNGSLTQGGVDFSSTTVQGAPGSGKAILTGGDNGDSGYLQLIRAGGVRAGYLGFEPTNVGITLENNSAFTVKGGQTALNGSFTVAGSTATISGPTSSKPDLYAHDMGGGLSLGGDAYGSDYCGSIYSNLSPEVATFCPNGGTSLGSYAHANNAPANGLLVPGSVGIGTPTPQFKLHVSSGQIFNDGTGTILTEAGSVAIGTTTSPTYLVDIQSPQASAPMIRLLNPGANNSTNDTFITFETYLSRIFSIGLNRNSGNFVFSGNSGGATLSDPVDAFSATGAVGIQGGGAIVSTAALTVNGNASFTGSAQIGTLKFNDGTSATSAIKQSTYTVLPTATFTNTAINACVAGSSVTMTTSVGASTVTITFSGSVQADSPGINGTAISLCVLQSGQYVKPCTVSIPLQSATTRNASDAIPMSITVASPVSPNTSYTWCIAPMTNNGSANAYIRGSSFATANFFQVIEQ